MESRDLFEIGTWFVLLRTWTPFKNTLTRSRNSLRESICWLTFTNLTYNPTSCTILFKYIYLYLFSACFGLPSAHRQGKVTVPMRHWYLSFWMCGVWSAGWIETFNPTSRPDLTHTEWQISVSHRYSDFLLTMGAWMPETCREET